MKRGTELIPSIEYDSPVALRRFLDERGLGMQKKFGQNFLVNRGARERLLDALGADAGDAAWEVGPGLGAMTSGLLERGVSVTAFEIDRGFAAALRDLFIDRPNFRLIEGDALRTWRTEAAAGLPPFFVGNLPYNIAATLLAAFIEDGAVFDRVVVTVQKEVAKRMTAKPGEDDYSSFSILCSSAYKVSPLMTLKPGSFYPAPNVDSAAVIMERRTDGSMEQLPRLFRPLVRALFSSRRKTVRNNLETYAASLGAGPRAFEITAEALDAARVDPAVRAETMDIASFVALATALEAALADGIGE
jgi:16S rRNA (adenine1518-N6/adenine1519-N6)-dimethyltransferase